jgi:hypothetical protein
MRLANDLIGLSNDYHWLDYALLLMLILLEIEPWKKAKEVSYYYKEESQNDTLK